MKHFRTVALAAISTAALAPASADAQSAREAICQQLANQGAEAVALCEMEAMAGQDMQTNGGAVGGATRGLNVQRGSRPKKVESEIGVAVTDPTASQDEPTVVTPRAGSTTTTVTRTSTSPTATARTPSQPVAVVRRGNGAVAPTRPEAGEAGDELRLTVTFETDSSVIREHNARQLVELCGVLAALPDGVSFDIYGHADAAGPADYNKRLSTLRARAVRRHLSQTCGVDLSRFRAIGFGEEKLLPDVPAVSEQNRRVEFRAIVS